MKYYLLTFKTLKQQHPTPTMYYKALEYVLKGRQMVVYDHLDAFELDKESKLHYHVVVATKYVRFKNVVSSLFENDMYFHFVEVLEETLPIVRSYLSKSRISEPDLYVQYCLKHEIEMSPYPFI